MGCWTPGLTWTLVRDRLTERLAGSRERKGRSHVETLALSDEQRCHKECRTLNVSPGRFRLLRCRCVGPRCAVRRGSKLKGPVRCDHQAPEFRHLHIPLAWVCCAAPTGSASRLPQQPHAGARRADDRESEGHVQATIDR